jgi:hypothetical protein
MISWDPPNWSDSTHLAVLLVYMSELEVDIPGRKRARWVVEDVSEALRRQK